MRNFTHWTAPLPGGGTSEETALTFDQDRECRLLVLPSLFDEANKLRRQTVEVMHRLDLSGIDSILPDLPGCNDSLQPSGTQTLEDWRFAAETAALHFKATHLLTIRCGALLAPDDLPGWRYAPVNGRSIVRSMIRARTIAAKEAGTDESSSELEKIARQQGIELAGWGIGKDLFTSLYDAKIPENDMLIDIEQGIVGGPGLWMRAEPDEDPEQADALAAIIAIGLADQ